MVTLTGLFFLVIAGLGVPIANFLYAAIYCQWLSKPAAANAHIFTQWAWILFFLYFAAKSFSPYH